jgi:hypothetical protein
MSKNIFLFTMVLTFLSITLKAQSVAINNFLVKENLLKNEKIAIIAADSVDKPIEQVNGTFQFTINGFKQELKFNDGVAVAPQQIEKSTFLYIKHKNDNGTHSKLYYVIKKETDLNPIKINWLILVLLPLAIIIIASMFKKFIMIAIIILALLFFFNYNSGLSLPTFFETVIDGIKSTF